LISANLIRDASHCCSHHDHGNHTEPAGCLYSNIIALRRGFVEAMVARAEPNRQQALRSALTPDFFSRRLPAFSGIVVDGEGYLWVESYDIDRGLPPAARRDTVSKTKAWSIFDRSGVWECDVLLPRDLKVTDIGRDYVLGFRLDPDGLPELMLYGLVRR
jgi:hypothetical protein